MFRKSDKGLFDDMTWQEILMASSIAMILIVVAFIAILAIVYVLPISDNSKPIVLILLGIISMLIGYRFLNNKLAINQDTKAATKTQTAVCHDSCSDVKSIKSIFSHSPTIPKAPTAINRKPKPTKNIPAIYFILSSIYYRIRKVLHRMI